MGLKLTGVGNVGLVSSKDVAGVLAVRGGGGAGLRVGTCALDDFLGVLLGFLRGVWSLSVDTSGRAV